MPEVAFVDLLARPDVVEHLELRSSVGLLALHGGLEPGTAEIAQTVAARTSASCYTISQPHDLRMHVPSVDADPDEMPHLASFLGRVHTVVSVHGYFRPLERPQAVLVGGGNRNLVVRLASELRAVLPDYRVVDDVDAIPSHMRGVDPRNPVNLSTRGGVQLELPHHLRSVRPSRYDNDTALHQRHTETLVATMIDFVSGLDD